MNKDLWNKLSTIMSSSLEEHLDTDKVDNVMSTWNEKRTQVSKLFSSEEKTTKRKKDPNAPKRPLSSYMCFCADKREQVKQGLPPGTSVTELSKRLGELWQSLPDSKKAKYVKQADEHKASYKKAMESYTPTESVEEETKGKKTRRKKDPNAPKRALSAYMFFAKDQRQNVKNDNPSLSFTDTTREIGRRWRELTDEQKVKYVKMNEEDKVRFESEKSSYTTPSTIEEEPVPKRGKAKAEKKTEKKTEPKTKTKPIKKTPGYQLFTNEQRAELEEEHPEWNEHRLVIEINKQWRGLEEEDRENYETEALKSEEEEEESSEEESDDESELMEEED